MSPAIPTKVETDLYSSRKSAIISTASVLRFKAITYSLMSVIVWLLCIQLCLCNSGTITRYPVVPLIANSPKCRLVIKDKKLEFRCEREVTGDFEEGTNIWVSRAVN